MQEHESENEHTEHHRKRTDVIRESTGNEALVLRVRQRPNGHLRGALQMRETDAVVVDLELEDAVDVGNEETGFVLAVADDLQGGPDERIDANEFELDVGGLERRPLAVRQLLDGNGVDDGIGDGVGSRWLPFALLVMFHGGDAKTSDLTEHPLADRHADRLVAGHLVLLATLGTVLHGRSECLVGEEEQRSGEDDPSVVARLNGCNQKRPTANGMRILLDRILRHIGIGCGVGGQDLQDERILSISQEASSAIQQRSSSRCSNDNRSFNQVLRRCDDCRMISGVLGVVIQMVNDGCSLFVHLEAAFGGQLTQSISRLGAGGHQNVASVVDELRDLLDAQVAAKVLDRWGKDDQILVQIFAVLGEDQAGIVGQLVGQFVAAF